MKTYQDVPVIDIMQQKVHAVLSSYTPRMMTTIKANVNINNEKNSQTKKYGLELLKIPSPNNTRIGNRNMAKDNQLESKMAILLDEGETYMEKTMNAAANNMSLLTLHAVELANHFEEEKLEQETQEKVVRNIEAHANFMAKKSDELRDRFEQAAIKFGYNQ